MHGVLQSCHGAHLADHFDHREQAWPDGLPCQCGACCVGQQAYLRQHRRIALHLRPRNPEQQPRQHAQSQSHDSLGFCRARRDAEVPHYETRFTKENPDEVEGGQDFTANLNPNSLEVPTNCKVEPSLRDVTPDTQYQFKRLGYFCVDPDSAPGKSVFTRTIGLKDTWAKIKQRAKK